MVATSKSPTRPGEVGRPAAVDAHRTPNGDDSSVTRARVAAGAGVASEARVKGAAKAEVAAEAAVGAEVEAGAEVETAAGTPGADFSAEAAARRIARLFPEVFRRYHWAQRVRGADLPVTPRALEVLQHLAASGPLTVGEQAEHLGLRRNSVSELLQRLETKGLVARIRDERDERRVLVWLTEAGRNVVSRVGQVLAPDLLAEVMATLSPTERATVVRGFELLAKAGADLSQPPGGPRTRATDAPPNERTHR